MKYILDFLVTFCFLGSIYLSGYMHGRSRGISSVIQTISELDELDKLSTGTIKPDKH